MLFVHLFNLCLFGFLFSSSSWCLGRAAVCDCGTPWTFLLPFFLLYKGICFKSCLVLFCSCNFRSFQHCHYLTWGIRANLCLFVRFTLVWFCLFPLPVRVWDGLRHVILALPRLFSSFFFFFFLFFYFGHLYSLSTDPP